METEKNIMVADIKMNKDEDSESIKVIHRFKQLVSRDIDWRPLATSWSQKVGKR